MTLNENDISKIEFACLDDRLLFAKIGEEMIGRNLNSNMPDNICFILNDLITVVDCIGLLKQVSPAIVTITDEKGKQIKDWKFSCRTLDISLNFFDKGYWITIEIENSKQKMPLSWEKYKQRIVPEGAIFH